MKMNLKVAAYQRQNAPTPSSVKPTQKTDGTFKTKKPTHHHDNTGDESTAGLKTTNS